MTSSQSWNSTGPSISAIIRSAHAVCSGLVELAMAASRDSKRTTATNMLSLVKPYVPPSQPAAPGPISVRHESPKARSSSWRVHGPWMT